MSEMKTKPNDADVGAYLAGLSHRGRAEDAAAVAEMMARVTGEAPQMWGESIIGFGAYDYARRDGSRHQWFLTGVSPRKANLVVYVMDGFSAYEEELAALGPHKHSVSCLYLGRLKRVNAAVLEKIISQSVEVIARRYS